MKHRKQIATAPAMSDVMTFITRFVPKFATMIPQQYASKTNNGGNVINR
jgi:hypothetical protein